MGNVPLLAVQFLHGMVVVMELPVATMVRACLLVPSQKLVTLPILLALHANGVRVQQSNVVMDFVRLASVTAHVARLGIVLTRHRFAELVVNVITIRLMVTRLGPQMAKREFLLGELSSVPLSVPMYAKMVPALLMSLIVLQFSNAHNNYVPT